MPHLIQCDKLRLVVSSPPGAVPIAALACAPGDQTLCAVGARIHVWHRTELVRTLDGHTGTVRHLLVFGAHLVSVADDQTMRVWDLADGTCAEPIELAAGERCVTLMHPDTYLNKVLVAYASGVMELWNLRTRARIHRFTSFVGGSALASTLTCVVQSPAVDVVGVGFADGRALLHNLKFDQTLGGVQQEDGGVTALVFRTDGTPTLCTASSRGHVSVWDLNTRTLVTMVRDAHARAAITALHFLPGQPVLLSSAGDNALRAWIFDAADGGARLLRERAGHRWRFVNLCCSLSYN